jgi:hypothetical protein
VGGLLDPVVRELARIADIAEARRPAAAPGAEDGSATGLADLHVELAALRAEVAGLRRAVAHLRSSNAPVPVELRPVVARAVLQEGASGGHGRPGECGRDERTGPSLS